MTVLATKGGASPPASEPQSDAVGSGTAAEEVSDRALAFARSAEGHAKRLELRLVECVASHRRRASLGLVLTGALLVAALAGAAGLFDRVGPMLGFLGLAALAAAALVVGLLDDDLRTRRQPVRFHLARDVALARLQGLAARRLDTVMAGWLRGEPSAESRGMMLSLLRWLEGEFAVLRRDEVDGTPVATPARRHERIVPRHTRTVVHLPDGRALAARIADLSCSGVAIETELTGVTLGLEVRIGERPAHAVRKLQRGTAFEFATPLDAATFDENVVL